MAYKGEKTVLYFEWSRVFGASAVVLLHVFATVLDNETVTQVGVPRATGWSLIQIIFSRWAVPVFLMITGALLLSDKRKLDYKKAFKYCKRMSIVLFVFGYLYCLLELMVSSKSFSALYLAKSLLNLIEGHSWSHMWYLYALIGIYLLSPLCKAFSEKVSRHEYRCLLFVLLIFSSIVPTINSAFHLSIVNITWVASSLLYFLLGHYIDKYDIAEYWYFIGFVCLFVIVIATIVGIVFFDDYMNWLRGPDCPFIVIFSCSVFMFFKKHFNKSFKKDGIVINISNYSFGIYLVHPIFLNLLYKVFNWQNISIPPILFEIVTFTIVFSLSYALTGLIKMIPVFGKLI